jgi:hypothetical protein
MKQDLAGVPMSPLMRTAPALAAALLLSACSFMPTYERPAAPVAATFPDAAAAEAPVAASAAELDWARFFADARLRTLVELALQNNRDLRVATLNVEQVRAQLGIQRAELYPSLGVGVQGSSTPASGGNQRAYSAGLSVTAYELDLFGRVRSLSEGGGYAPPPPMPMYARAVSLQSADSSPVSGGELAVRIDITGVYDIVR